MVIEIAESNEQDELSFSDIMAQASQEFDQIQKEMKEIGILIQQSSNEVEKLAQRNAQINNKVRLMENNLDTMPRQDIKETYKVAQDAQNRLFTMRGQVEQLQGKQQYLERYAEQLKKIISGYQDEPGGGRSHGFGDGLSDATASNIMNIINAQENERLILSKELHDGPAQSLTNLILQAEICERLFDKDPMRARTELSNLKEAVNGTFRKIREYIFELRPMILDDLGLTPTLKQYCGDFEKKCSIPCKLSVNGPEQRLPPHIEVTLFRIIQSLLKNVRDHANATHVEVMLDIQSDRVSASVIDDGGGFEVDSTMARASEQKKMGLISIQEQVAMLHGEINFDTRPGEGANISVSLPLE